MSNNNLFKMQSELLTKINDITKKIDDSNTELTKLKELTRKIRQKYLLSNFSLFYFAFNGKIYVFIIG